ncbi:UDP-N-acetylmuramoyl-tripeptide--D-alanyl-D-alanine ligase [Roseovarius sp. D22-M7]|uniref:UDP-N-acetylmuramoyl-tripeptide--D-alanyl-D- alanine ligase n=1 Tax=Roseovarius sp. D22-M7 TaxID=3127116 RepID=UPI00300FD1B9
MTLWTARDAAAATGGRATADWTAHGLSIDSRTLARGDLFVALRAARDGHGFVADALAKGAAAALVDHVPDGVPADAPLLVVEDVQAALEALGAAGRARMQGRVVAVTGSVGKTSTKEMLRDVLGAQGRTHAAEASYNNHWGVPLTLARMPKDTEFAVIEIGMNHPGEIAPLARLARPDVGIVTTVAAAHLEAFEDLDGIAREKASLFEGLESGGTAILNADLETTPILRAAADAAGAHVVGFGTTGAECRMKSVRLVDDRTIAEAEMSGERILFRIKSPGRHFAMNGLAVLAAARALDLDLALAVMSLGQWTPYKGRGAREVIRLDRADEAHNVLLYDDSYNANPTSVAAALEVLAAARVTHDIGRVARGRRIAYLGDMKELGPEAPEMHRALADHPAMAGIDVVHTVGQLMQGLAQSLPARKRGRHCDTAQEMAARVRHDLDAGDVVLVKGSLSTGLAAVVQAIRKLDQEIPGREGTA